MDERGLEALIASSPENVAYTSGFHAGLFNRPQRSRLAFVIVPRDESRPSAIVLPHYYLSHLADRPLPIDNVWTYGYYHIADEQENLSDPISDRFRELLANANHADDGISALLRALEALGLVECPIGLDETDLSADVLAALESAIGEDVYPASDLFHQIRMVKTPQEIDRLRKSTRITEEAMMAAIAAIKPGEYESALEHIFRREVTTRQAHFTFACMPAGMRSAFPACQTSDYEMQHGDLIKLDAGCMFDLYHSDVGRTAVLGQPSKRQRDMYEAMWAGTREAVRQIRPGIKASDLFRLAMRTTQDAGISEFRRHHCGHGQGLEGYEPPMIAPHDDTPLETGMVLNIENPYNEVGFGGMIIEETVLVTGDGCETLTTIGSDLYVVGDGN